MRSYPGFGVELLLGVLLVLRCVPSYGLREDPDGAAGTRGGDVGDSGEGFGGSRGGRGAAGGPAGGAPNAGGSGSPGGSGGAGAIEDGGDGSGGSPEAGAGAGGTAGAGGASGKGGTGGGGTGGKGGASGAGGSGTVRSCGSGGAPYSWANWCMPNHPGEGPHPQSYDTSTPGVVRDNVTGLVWEHPENGVFAQRTFAEASTHCNDLAATAYGGYDDWRVPTLIELVSITDYAVYDPAIDTAAFPNTPSGPFWTSTSYANPIQAWEVDSLYGVVAPIDVVIAGNVRCVR